MKYPILAIFASILFLSSYFYHTDENENLIMGNPSKASANISSPNNYLMVKKQYRLSYNKSRGIANWVSWHLTNKWITQKENVKRKNKFTPDNDLPEGWYKVNTKDYTNSGFSRGHTCCSADRFDTQEDNDATFLMTNIFPQTQENNNTAWKELEDHCRDLALSGNELYIIAGSFGDGGTGLKGKIFSLAGGKLCIPSKVWKVIMVLPEGDNDLRRVTKNTRLIAVIMNNDLGPFNEWGTYRVSVDSVEHLTGYDFFSNVPVKTQEVIEARVDNADIQ